MLTLVTCEVSARLERVLSETLPQVRRLPAADYLQTDLRGQRVIFAASVGEFGMGEGLCRLLADLRRKKDGLAGCVGGVILDGATELDTKQLARMLIFAANGAGCAFPGKALVEATASLHNLEILARRNGLDREAALLLAVRTLAQRVEEFTPRKQEKPKLLILHASDHKTSNTLALADMVCQRLEPHCELKTISLRNGTIQDCRGCSYSVCSHFAQSNSCFYGGTLVEDVFPAVLESDALLILCPNYNDALGANIMAFINRMTSLVVSNSLAGRALFGIVVSGYSGGDLVAQQLLGALCLNKSLDLPPRFCLLQTANDPGEVQRLPEIETQAQEFAEGILWYFQIP